MEAKKILELSILLEELEKFINDSRYDERFRQINIIINQEFLDASRREQNAKP